MNRLKFSPFLHLSSSFSHIPPTPVPFCLACFALFSIFYLYHDDGFKSGANLLRRKPPTLLYKTAEIVLSVILNEMDGNLDQLSPPSRIQVPASAQASSPRLFGTQTQTNWLYAFCKVDKLTSSSALMADVLPSAYWISVSFEREPKSGSVHADAIIFLVLRGMFFVIF